MTSMPTATLHVRTRDDLDAVLLMTPREYYAWRHANDLNDYWKQGSTQHLLSTRHYCLSLDRRDGPTIIVDRTWDRSAMQWSYHRGYGHLVMSAPFATVAEACHDAERMIAEGRGK